MLPPLITPTHGPVASPIADRAGREGQTARRSQGTGQGSASCPPDGLHAQDTGHLRAAPMACRSFGTAPGITGTVTVPTTRSEGASRKTGAGRTRAQANPPKVGARPSRRGCNDSDRRRLWSPRHRREHQLPGRTGNGPHRLSGQRQFYLQKTTRQGRSLRITTSVNDNSRSSDEFHVEHVPSALRKQALRSGDTQETP